MILWTLAIIMIAAAVYRTSYHQHYFYVECSLGLLCPANCGNYHIG